jgi:hypothetical protein
VKTIVTVRMRPLYSEGVTAWEFDGQLVGGIVGGIAQGVRKVTDLAEDICDLYHPVTEPAFRVSRDGEDWLVEVLADA